MQLLPTAEDQTILIGEMATLLHELGPEKWLRSPLVLIDRQHFPDPWGDDPASVWLAARRLFDQADLPDMTIRVEVFDRPLPSAPEEMITLLERGEQSAVIGVRRQVCSAPEEAICLLSDIVAGVYREERGVCVADPERETMLRGLTSLYLGFGVLALGSEIRLSDGGLMGIPGLANAMRSVGYSALQVQATAFLLVVQGFTRGWSDNDFHRIAGQLEIDQQAAFEAARGELEPWREQLLQGLRIPADIVEHSPEVEPTPRAIRPDEIRVREVDRSGTHPDGDGSPVFRVKVRGVHSSIITAVVIWSLPAILLWLRGQVGAMGCLLVLAICETVGLYLALTNIHDRCSNVGCKTKLPGGVTVCPGCGGKIVGRIVSYNHRLEAEEAYLRGERPEVGDLYPPV